MPIYVNILKCNAIFYKCICIIFFKLFIDDLRAFPFTVICFTLNFDQELKFVDKYHE